MGGRRCFPRFARRKGSLEPGGAGYRSRLLLQRATCHHSTGRSSLDCHCRHHLYEQLDGSLQPPECRYRRHERGFGNGWHKILRCCFGLFHHIHYLSASSYYLDSQNRSTHFPLRHCLAWGVVMVGFSFVTKWWELVPLRLVLGLFEAGYFPGVVYLISTWYSRYDMQKRYAGFYALGLVASGCSGILAYGLMQLDGRGGL